MQLPAVCLVLSVFLFKGIATQTSTDVQKQETLMNTILGSMDELRTMVWEGEKHSTLDLQLAQRMDRLQAQMAALSSELSALGSQFNGATDMTLRLMNNLARATKSNSRSINGLWGQLRQVMNAQEVGLGGNSDGSSDQNSQGISSAVSGKSPRQNSREKSSTVSGKSLRQNSREKSLGLSGKPPRQGKCSDDIGDEREKGALESGENDENSGTASSEISEASPLKVHPANVEKVTKGYEGSGKTHNDAEVTVTTTSGVSVRPTTSSGISGTSQPKKVNVSALPKITPPKNIVRSTNKKHQQQNGHANNKETLMMLRAIAKVSRDNEASAKVISKITRRVVALERYASPRDGALVNASRVIDRELQKLQAGLGRMRRGQGRVNSEMALKLNGLEKRSESQRGRLGHKQEKLVVDTSSALVSYKYLNAPIRVRFKRKFTTPPEVFAAISGFAMDPDYASLKSESNESKIQDLLDSHIYAVQTNFYAVRIESITNIDTSGFSVKVYDGRDLLYSAFQWVQVQWVAIGK